MANIVAAPLPAVRRNASSRPCTLNTTPRPLLAAPERVNRILRRVAAGAEGGAHSHTRRALAAGATRAEIEHVALLAITTLGFPRAMTGLAWMRDVLDAPPKE